MEPSSADAQIQDNLQVAGASQPVRGAGRKPGRRRPSEQEWGWQMKVEE